MQYQFQLLQTTRTNILNLLETLPPDRLLAIPDGFRNNLLWHAGHLLATQQLLMYGRAGIPFRVPAEFVDTFRKGTEGRPDYPPETMDFIKQHLLKTAQQAAVDCQNRLFDDYQAYETSYGIELTSIEEAVAFNNAHEALHLGYMMGMRKALLG